MRVVENLLQPFVSADAKVIIAMDANLKVFFQLLLIEVLATLLATDKNVFSAHDPVLFTDRFDLAFLFTKPGHRNQGSDISPEISNFGLPGLKEGSTERVLTAATKERRRNRDWSAIVPLSFWLSLTPLMQAGR